METTIEKIKKIIERVNSEISQHGIEEINKITYSIRERGEDMIYFSKEKDGIDGEIYLVPRPLKSQKEYYNFFNEIAPNAKSFKKYALYIYKNRIEFKKYIKFENEIYSCNIF